MRLVLCPLVAEYGDPMEVRGAMVAGVQYARIRADRCSKILVGRRFFVDEHRHGTKMNVPGRLVFEA